MTGAQKCSMLKWGATLSFVSVVLGIVLAGLASITPMATASSASCEMRRGLRKFGILVRFVGCGWSISSNMGNIGCATWTGVGALGTPNPKIRLGFGRLV